LVTYPKHIIKARVWELPRRYALVTESNTETASDIRWFAFRLWGRTAVDALAARGVWRERKRG
jgi:hypothetical protein